MDTNTNPTPEQVNKATRVLVSVATAIIFNKAMSAVYDHQYRKGIRKHL